MNSSFDVFHHEKLFAPEFLPALNLVQAAVSGFFRQGHEGKFKQWLT